MWMVVIKLLVRLSQGKVCHAIGMTFAGNLEFQTAPHYVSSGASSVIRRKHDATLVMHCNQDPFLRGSVATRGFVMHAIHRVMLCMNAESRPPKHLAMRNS